MVEFLVFETPISSPRSAFSWSDGAFSRLTGAAPVLSSDEPFKGLRAP